MSSCAPMGSYTPGAKTYGFSASNRRSRLLGASFRDAGTLNPSGRRGVETSSMEGLLLVLVIAVAGLGAFTLVLRRFPVLFLQSDFLIHVEETIKEADIR